MAPWGSVPLGCPSGNEQLGLCVCGGTLVGQSEGPCPHPLPPSVCPKFPLRLPLISPNPSCQHCHSGFHPSFAHMRQFYASLVHSFVVVFVEAQLGHFGSRTQFSEIGSTKCLLRNKTKAITETQGGLLSYWIATGCMSCSCHFFLLTFLCNRLDCHFFCAWEHFNILLSSLASPRMTNVDI